MLPRIVIIGRPNVGKSSLLNMLAHRRISIVDPVAGVTRDRIRTIIEVPPRRGDADDADTGHGFAELIDTGGYGVEDAQQLTPEIERQISLGLDEADAVLFVVDAQSGIVPLDKTVARLLRNMGSKGKSVILVANKVDDGKFEADAYEASSLGFGQPVMISATTKHNLDALYERLRQSVHLGTADDAQVQAARLEGIRVAVVGKRNAGKSTLVNALAGEQRVIVSEQEGTTRDAIDVRLDVDGHIFTLIDTAGVRKRKSVQDDIEYYALHRALRSVRRADVCLLVIDATLSISQVDRQLVNEIVRHYKPVVIVINKWDLARDKADEQSFASYLDDVFKNLRFAPIVFTSALEGEGMRELLGMALNLHEQAGHRVATAQLNEFIEANMMRRGPGAKGGKRAKVYYATQVETHPPTIVLSVNAPELFDNNYQLFLLNRMRDELPFAEVPIKLEIRGKDRK